MLTSATAVAIVLGLLGALLWGAKRLNSPAAKTNTLQLIDSLTIAPGRTVAVIRSGERHFLLGATAQSINLIAELRAENGQALKASR